MKKFLITIVFLTAGFVSLFAEENKNDVKVNFELNPYTAITLGKFGEYLYVLDYKPYIISYLDWQTLPLFKTGLSFNTKLNDLKLLADFNYTLPFRCGHMYDNDYTPDFKMCYNIFDNYSLLGLEGSLGFEIALKQKNNFTISPKMIFTYSYNSFQAKNGHGWYGSRSKSSTGKNEPWDSEYAHYAARVNDIFYYQKIFYIFTGCSFDWQKDRHNFKLTTLISPVSIIKTVDYHSDETQHTRDFCLGATQNAFFTRYKINADYNFQLKNNLFLSAGLTSLFGPKIQGQLYHYNGRTDNPFDIFKDKKLSEVTDQPSASDVLIFDIKAGIVWKW